MNFSLQENFNISYFHFNLNLNEPKTFPIKLEVSIYIHFWLPNHKEK